MASANNQSESPIWRKSSEPTAGRLVMQTARVCSVDVLESRLAESEGGMRRHCTEQLGDMERVDGRSGIGCSTFDEVLTRYQADIYRFGAHLTGDRAAANDLYQETLWKAFHAFEIDRPASGRAWLFTIATNAFLSDPCRRGPKSAPGEERAPEVQGTSPDQAGRLDAHMLLREVEAFVAFLPPEQRVALVQRKFHDLSYTEIAATLGCSEAVARASVHEAVRTLRTHIGDRL